MTEETKFQRFEGFQPWGNQGPWEWVCLHEEEKSFPGHPKDMPAIKLCGQTLRIWANDAWSKLPKEEKLMMVCHEIGHKEYQHYLEEYGFLKRIISLSNNELPKKEIQADKYAAKLVGKVNYLDFLKRMMLKSKENNAGYLQLRDYELRIAALEDR